MYHRAFGFNFQDVQYDRVWLELEERDVGDPSISHGKVPLSCFGSYVQDLRDSVSVGDLVVVERPILVPYKTGDGDTRCQFVVGSVSKRAKVKHRSKVHVIKNPISNDEAKGCKRKRKKKRLN